MNYNVPFFMVFNIVFFWLKTGDMLAKNDGFFMVFSSICERSSPFCFFDRSPWCCFCAVVEPVLDIEFWPDFV